MRTIPPVVVATDDEGSQDPDDYPDTGEAAVQPRPRRKPPKAAAPVRDPFTPPPSVASFGGYTSGGSAGTAGQHPFPAVVATARELDRAKEAAYGAFNDLADETDTPPDTQVDRFAPQTVDESVLYLPSHRIEASPDNPRGALDSNDPELLALVESVRQLGILVPLTVGPEFQNNPGYYPLIAGHRRLHAARAAGLTEVPVLMRRDLDSPSLAALGRLVENLHRVDLSPLAEAEAYRQLTAVHGWTHARVAGAVGRGTGHISRRLSLLTLIPEATKALKEGRLPVTEAPLVASLPPAQQAGIVAQIAEGYSSDQAIRRIREAAALVLDRQAVLKQLRAAGHTIIDLPDTNYWEVDTGSETIRLPYGGLEIGVHSEYECHAIAIGSQPSGKGDDPLVRWGVPVCTDPDAHGWPLPPLDQEPDNSVPPRVSRVRRTVAPESTVGAESDEALAFEDSPPLADLASDSPTAPWRAHFLAGLLSDPTQLLPAGTAEHLNRTLIRALTTADQPDPDPIVAAQAAAWLAGNPGFPHGPRPVPPICDDGTSEHREWVEAEYAWNETATEAGEYAAAAWLELPADRQTRAALALVLATADAELTALLDADGEPDGPIDEATIAEHLQYLAGIGYRLTEDESAWLSQVE